MSDRAVGMRNIFVFAMLICVSLVVFVFQSSASGDQATDAQTPPALRVSEHGTDTGEVPLNKNAQIQMRDDLAEEFVLRNVAILSRGNGVDEVGIQEDPHGEPPTGPAGIAVRASGDVLLLDSINNRILEISPLGAVKETVEWGNMGWVSDLVLGLDGDVYLLAGDSGDIVVLSKASPDQRVPLSFPDNFQPSRLAVDSEGDVHVEGWLLEDVSVKPQSAVFSISPDALRGTAPIETDSHVGVQSTFAGLQSVRLVQTGERAGTVQITDLMGRLEREIRIETGDPLLAVTLIGYDVAGNCYLNILTVVPAPQGLLLNRPWLAKYSSNGELLAAIELEQQMYSVPEHAFVVTPTGEVCQLLPQEDEVHVLHWDTVVGLDLETREPEMLWQDGDDDLYIDFGVVVGLPEENERAVMLDLISRDQVMAAA